MSVGNQLYVRAKFCPKCSISKRVALLAKEVFGGHPINNMVYLKDPHNLFLNSNVSVLQLQLFNDFKGPRIMNNKIQQLEIYYDMVDYDPELVTLFPNVEVVKLFHRLKSNLRLNLAYLSRLKSLELHCFIIVEQLPTSLVKLVLGNNVRQIGDLSHLKSLKQLLVLYFELSHRMVRGEIPLPQSIVRMEVRLIDPIIVKLHLSNLKELLIHYGAPVNITKHNFPSLRFVQFIRPSLEKLSDSTLSSTNLINQGLIKSVQLINYEYLVELSCFPRWIHYPSIRCIVDLYNHYSKTNEEDVNQ
ncbi:hypothetical protein P9112_005934 [Eukaryota sp. TZLM1-RC]